MELTEFYDKIENPIENPEVLTRLIDEYIKSDGNDFYERVTTSINKKYHSNVDANTEGFDRCFTTIYNIWKKSAETIDFNKFLELYKEKTYDRDYIPFRDDLLKTPDFKSITDISKCLEESDKKTADENGFARTLAKYKWTHQTNEKTGGIIICSTDVHAEKPEYEEGPHRLYLNPEYPDLYTLITEFIKKCEENNLPYKLEFNPNGKSDMMVTINATDDTLIPYVDLLKTINDENPEMKARMPKPSVLVGSVDGWIGYGYDIDGEYAKSRADLIEESIREVINEWVTENKDMIISDDNEEVKLSDYIASICTDKIVAEIGTMKSDSRRKIFDRVSYVMDEALMSLTDNRKFNLPVVTEAGYANVFLDNKLLHNALRESIDIFPKLIPNFNEEFTKLVENRILDNAIKAYFDPNKFCIDNAFTLSLFGRTKEAESVETEELNIGELEPDELEEFGLDELSDEPFELTDIKVDKLPELDEKPTLAKPTDNVEIVDFDDEINYEKNEEPETKMLPAVVSNASSIQKSNSDEDASKKPELKDDTAELESLMKEIDTGLKVTDEPKQPQEEPEGKSVFESVMEEIYEEQRKQDEHANLVTAEPEDDIKIPEKDTLIKEEVKQEEQPQLSLSDSKTIVDYELILPNGGKITLGDYYLNYYKTGKPFNAFAVLYGDKKIPARELVNSYVLPSIGQSTLEEMSAKVKKM